MQHRPASTLIIGGRASGKSALAEQMALSNGAEPLYIATGLAVDEETKRRIEQHRARRGAQWAGTIETPTALARAIAEHCTPERVLLVECLTFWLNNVLYENRDPSREVETLCRAVAARSGALILVTSDVGLGLVPATEQMRHFVDVCGDMNQRIAALCTDVYWCVAGCKTKIK